MTRSDIILLDLPATHQYLNLLEGLFPERELEQAEYWGLFVLSKLMDEVIYQSQERAAWRSQAGGAWQPVSVTFAAQAEHNQWRLIKKL